MMNTPRSFSPAVILSAYTGVLMCGFSDMHEYIEYVMERPVFTHELGSECLVDQIKEKIKNNGDFESAMNSVLSFPTIEVAKNGAAK